MALPTGLRDGTQVLFAHMQRGIVSGSRTQPVGAIVRAASVLGEAAALLGLPMTFALVPRPDDDRPIEELASHATGGNLSFAHAGDPFVDAALAETLAGHGRYHLVLAGFAAEVVVLHAALAALGRGYRVSVAVDAVGGLSERTERAALDHLRDVGVRVLPVFSLMSELAPDFARSPGSELLPILQRLKA